MADRGHACVGRRPPARQHSGGRFIVGVLALSLLVLRVHIAAEAVFRIEALRDATVDITSPVDASPGTLVDFEVPGGDRPIVVTLRIASVQGKGAYTAVTNGTNAGDLGRLRPGMTGKTNTVVHSGAPLLLAITGDGGDIGSELARRRPQGWKPAAEAGDARLEWRQSSAGRVTVTASTVWKERSERTFDDRAAALDFADDFARIQVAARYWLGLDNHFIRPTRRSELRPILEREVTGRIPVVEVTPPQTIPLSLRSGVDGPAYLSLFSPSPDGTLVVFYPNRRGGADDVFVGWDLANLTERQLYKLDARPGFSREYLVAVVSRVRRPLREFVPDWYTAPVVNAVTGERLSLDAVGPGIYRPDAERTVRRDGGVDDLRADSWDVSRLEFVARGTRP